MRLSTWQDIRTVIATVVLLVCTFCIAQAAEDRLEGTAVVVDGNTIEIEGVRIRFYGIDAAEPGQRCKTEDGGEWACGQRAIDVLAELAENKEVTCKVEKRDAFGRPIGTCHQGNVNLNAHMVDKCLAWAYLQDSADYRALEYFTRRSTCGIWSGHTEPPWKYRNRLWAIEEQRAPRGCPIKGSKSAAGRIYHMPWSPLYAQTQVNEDEGGRWFCDEGAAIKAGWQAPRWR